MASKVFDGLFVGDAEASQDSEFIELNKISYIINCAGRQLPNLYELHGIRYLTYPWLDTPDFQIFDANGVVVQQIASFVDEALTNGEAVLCHSLQGSSRCSLCIIAYLMYKFWWNLEKALEFVCATRPDFSPNPGFLQQLQIVDLQLQAARRRIILDLCSHSPQSTTTPQPPTPAVVLKACELSVRTPIPLPQLAASIMKSPNPSKQTQHPSFAAVQAIVQCKLLDWDSGIVSSYLKMTNKLNTDSSELLLVNSYLNSLSSLTAFPSAPLAEEHLATRLRWLDMDARNSSKTAIHPTNMRINTGRMGATQPTPNNIAAGVVKLELERPPNDEYRTDKLGAGWTDRERKLEDGPKEPRQKVVRSILTGGVMKRRQQEAAFASAATFDGGEEGANGAPGLTISASPSSPEQRLTHMMKQFQEDRGSPTFGDSNNSLGEHIVHNSNSVAQHRSARVGGLRDSIALAREHTEDSDVMSAAATAAAMVAGGAGGGGVSKTKSDLARVQQDAKRHNLSPTNPYAAANSGSSSALRPVTQQLQFGGGDGTSVSTTSTPSFAVPNFMDNMASLGSLSSMGSPIHRPMSAQQLPPSMSLGSGGLGGGATKKSAQQQQQQQQKRPTSAGAVSAGHGVTGVSQQGRQGIKGKKKKQSQQNRLQEQQMRNVWTQPQGYSYSASPTGNLNLNLNMSVSGRPLSSESKQRGSPMRKAQGSGQGSGQGGQGARAHKAQQAAASAYGAPLGGFGKASKPKRVGGGGTNNSPSSPSTMRQPKWRSMQEF